MAGKTWTIPAGMVLKKYYCHKCGERLEKEKTHRVVTEDDRDYYSYHDRGHFPKGDYDVYGYRFKCPSCESRITYDDQRVIEMIQKKCMRKRLSDTEINRNRKECEKRTEKSALWGKIISPLIFLIIAFSVYFFLGTDRTREDLLRVVVFMAILTAYIIIRNVTKHKGNSKSNSYSYEERTKLERLRTYSSHNKKLVEASEKCYCFYCMSEMDSKDIKVFVDGEQTATCPNCLTDAILPDSVEEPIDSETLSLMNEYWF